MKQQRILGIVLIILCLFMMAVASQGTTVEDRDCTIVVILLPLGIYALRTKTPITYYAQAEVEQQKTHLEL